MLNWLDKIVVNSAKILKLFIYPFITSLFALLNYLKIREMLLDDAKAIVWARVFLIASVLYFLLTFGFGVYWLIENMKK